MSRSGRIVTRSIIMLLVILTVLVACAPAATPERPAPAPPVVQTVVVPQTVAVPQTVVAPETVVVPVTVAPPTPAAKEPIRIGVLTIGSGAFAALGADGEDGIHMAFNEINNQVAGRPVRLFIEDTAADADKAVEKLRALITRDNVQIVLGPLSGAEGLAVKKAAPEFPNVTIIVVGAASEDVTMRGVEPNVWRTSYTGAQPMFPLGDYAYAQGYRKVVVIAEDYAFPYAQVGGFMYTFCKAGGQVIKKFWVPIGTSDYSSIFPAIPKDTDAIYLQLSGTDVVDYVNQMAQFGLLGKIPILGGTVAIDASAIAALDGKLEGIVSGSIMTGDLDTPEFKALDTAFEKMRGRPPSLFVENYYRGARWAILALQKINGNIEDQKAFRDALQNTEFMAPASYVSFDAFHNVVSDVYINQVKKVGDEYRNVHIKVYPKVSQFWTATPEEYQAQPPYDRDYMSCP